MIRAVDADCRTTKKTICSLYEYESKHDRYQKRIFKVQMLCLNARKMYTNMSISIEHDKKMNRWVNDLTCMRARSERYQKSAAENWTEICTDGDYES